MIKNNPTILAHKLDFAPVCGSVLFVPLELLFDEVVLLLSEVSGLTGLVMSPPSLPLLLLLSPVSMPGFSPLPSLSSGSTSGSSPLPSGSTPGSPVLLRVRCY